MSYRTPHLDPRAFHQGIISDDRNADFFQVPTADQFLSDPNQRKQPIQWNVLCRGTRAHTVRDAGKAELILPPASKAHRLSIKHRFVADVGHQMSLIRSPLTRKAQLR